MFFTNSLSDDNKDVFFYVCHHSVFSQPLLSKTFLSNRLQTKIKISRKKIKCTISLKIKFYTYMLQKSEVEGFFCYNKQFCLFVFKLSYLSTRLKVNIYNFTMFLLLWICIIWVTVTKATPETKLAKVISLVINNINIIFI